MFALLDEIVTQERQAERHQAGRRHRDDAAQEAVPVQPVRVRADAAATTSTRTAGRGLSDDDYDDIFGEGQSDEEEGLWEQDEAERLRESKRSDPLSAAKPGELERLQSGG